MRSVFISGASRGLGAALAAEYRRRGATVHAGMRGAVPPADGLLPVTLDVTSETSVADAVAQAVSAGSIDLLVNNAGIHLGGPLTDLPEADFKRVLDVNLLGAWRLTKAAIPHMTPGGTIAMISSLSGLVGLPEDGAYAASKFALEGMSQSLAAEVAPLGLRVVLFEPGAIATGFAGSVRGDDPASMAATIADILADPADQLRFPLGDTARQVAESLQLDTGARAEAIVFRMTGLGWRARQPAVCR